MQVTRVLHASVNTAAAPEATERFYGQVLGLPTAARPEMGIPGQWFGVADAQLHLIGHPASDERLDPTRHHVCFGVADLAAAVATLEANAVAHFVADGQVFCCDPAGNVVELQQDPGT